MQYNFDRVSHQYDETRGLPGHAADRIATWVLARLPADPAVAEIGVGSGRIAIPFIRRGVRFTGFDISERMLERARAKLDGQLQNAQLLMADITEPLSLPEHSQDAVIAVHILHLVDPVKALQQVRRVLKPNGAFIWGYQDHEGMSVRERLREHLRQAATSLGHQGRNFRVPEARALLAQWGAQAARHVVVSWVEEESPGQVLADLGSRTHSFTWSIPNDMFEKAMDKTRDWAVREYVDLERTHEAHQSFVVDWYQF